MLLEVGPELEILGGDRILADLGQKEERQERAEEAKTAAHEKRVLASAGTVGATGGVVLDYWKNVRAYKSADLTERGSNGVILASDGGGTGFGSDKADVVARTGFAEGEEDAVDDDEAGDGGGFVEEAVAPRHEEADEALQEDEDDEGVFGADPVADEGAADGAGEVEDVDDGVPAE